jgi:hypothetical protein
VVEIPKIPSKEELEYKEKTFLLSVYEQFENSRHLKILFWVLVGFLILALPAQILLRNYLAKVFISSYKPPVVNENPYNPAQLEVRKTGILKVSGSTFSAYGQILNSNPELSARSLDYRFIFYDSERKILKEFPGQDFLFPAESRFILAPSVELDKAASSVELVVDGVKWTRFLPPIEPNLTIMQQKSGTSLEGKFFVEGLVKNPTAFRIKKVVIDVVVFDAANQNPAAVNSTICYDLESFESRYFRVIWPKNFTGLGQVQIIPKVNSFEPVLIYESPDKIPAR